MASETILFISEGKSLILKEVAATFDYDSVQFVLEDIASREPPADEREHFDAVVRAAKKPDWLLLKKLLYE
ncbi:hypothetical protein [uncultured Selenomonas sp.]|uniref:hypothetical protein n=1 Tax=uncultured Selenomonas sp. TaxID=159275 RepID=UPI0025D1B574|nr:hypothetical protein [uncultured Selenomonas sp.]